MSVAALATIFAVSAFVPAVALGQANIVNDVIQGVEGILGGGADGGGSVEPQAGVPPEYTPPLDGGNPHGQGDVAGADLLPDNDLPQPGGSVDDSSEELTVGQSRGEQDENGDYHGRVVLLDENLVNLVNISIETDEGDENNGPLGPLNTALSEGCVTFGQPANCIQLLAMNSETSDTGSENSFQAAGVNLGNEALGGLTLGVARSEGTISGPGNEPGNGNPCQTAEGDSNVANAELAPTALPGLEAEVLSSNSESTACNNGFEDVDNDGSAISLSSGERGVVIPPGCEEGTTNETFLPLVVLSAVCNADDNSEDGPYGVQVLDGPYGVREALGVFLLPLIIDLPVDSFATRQASEAVPLLKLVAAGAESHAEAPAGPDGGTPTIPPGDAPDGGPDGGGGGRDGGPGGPREGAGAGPAAGGAQAADEDLAFTGANMAVLGLIGGMLIVGGLGLARASTRRHRRLAA